MSNSVSTETPKILTAQEKKAEWRDKSKNYVTDTILKVSAIAGLILLGAAFFAAAVMCPIMIPSIGVAGAIGFIIGGSTLSGLSIVGASCLPCFLDFTDFRNPKNVVDVFSKIETADTPLPLSYFKQLNRYGIISESELSKRESLEGKAKEYNKLIKEIPELQKQISSKQKALKNLKEHPRLATQQNEINVKIKQLEERVKFKKESKHEIKEEFLQFHHEIIRFEPNP